MTSRLAVIRAAWGGMLLLAPAPLLSWTSSAPTPAAVTVLRVLGARQLLQAGAAVRWRSTTGAGLGAAADGLHALTAVAFSLSTARWRRAAAADALVATVLAAAGWVLRPAVDG